MSADDIRRGERARMILDDELVKEALDALESMAIRDWRYSEPAAADARERSYYFLAAVDLFKAHFATMVSDGIKAVADAEFQKKQQR